MRIDRERGKLSIDWKAIAVTQVREAEDLNSHWLCGRGKEWTPRRNVMHKHTPNWRGLGTTMCESEKS